MKRTILSIMTLLLFTVTAAFASETAVPGSGMDKSIRQLKQVYKKMEDRKRWLMSLGGANSRSTGDARLDAIVSAGSKAGSGDALARMKPGSTFNFYTLSGSLKDNAKEIYEYNDGQSWRYSTFGYAGSVHTWDFGSYPLVTKKISLGQKFVTYLIDMEKKKISVIDSALALNISGALNLAGQNASVSENVMNPILRKYYLSFYEPYGDTVDSIINSLLVDEDFRYNFVRKDIPTMIQQAKKAGEQPW